MMITATYSQFTQNITMKRLGEHDWLSMVLKPIPNQRWKPVSLQNLQPIFNC